MADSIRQRVYEACNDLIRRDKSVGPIDLLCRLGFLHASHIQQWQTGNPSFQAIEPHIQCGPKKREQTWAAFKEWTLENNLEPFRYELKRASHKGSQPLQITSTGDPKQEEFFRTRYRSADLTDKQKQRLDEKHSKPPDLFVFELVSEPGNCSECDSSLNTGDLFFLEEKNLVCLQCADMDHLEFLPSGDATLTRRSRKHSPLSAIVKRFNRRRKRYDRLGILVTPESIDAAHAQNKGDELERAKKREQAKTLRIKQDKKLIDDMTEMILTDFPGCSSDEAHQIAAHTALRGSGRVGRSEAGRNLKGKAIELAVIAWVRHQHTDYDELLMRGVERYEARDRIKSKRDDVLNRWRAK